MNGIAVLLAASLIAVSAVGSVGHAATPSPSLQTTLGFIRDKISEEGSIAYASTSNDPSTSQTWTNRFTVEASQVTHSDSDCSVGFHWRTTVDGKPSQDMDSTIPFKLVTSVSVFNMDEDMARLNAAGGHSSWVTKIRPNVWVVLLHKNNGHTNTVDFRDRDMAERVAKAMRHAAELCGGAKSLPF